MYDTFVARSFSKHEQKKLGYGAFAACFLIALSFCTVLEPYLGPLPSLNLRLSIPGGGERILAIEEKSAPSLKHVIATTKQKEVKPLCDITRPRTSFCDMKGDIRIQSSSSSVFAVSSETDISEENRKPWMIRPYARKEDKEAMSTVREWSVKLVSAQENVPRCTKNHSVPAVLFSIGGYSGNHFHAFTDIIIPLFLTSRPFDGQVQFLVTNKLPWWIRKFSKILENLSRYKIIDIDSELGEVHCFQSAIVGLKRHKELGIDPKRSANTMKDFKEFLRKSYFLKRRSAIRLGDTSVNKTKPRLLVISRKQTRAFTNIDRIVKMARGLGFNVVVAEPSMNIQEVAELVNSCDVVMGVHGAGLTNILFLPENAVLVQIVPLGNVEWISRSYFGEPSKDMGIGYLEYKISLEESSLIEQYPLDHLVFRDPNAVHKGDWLRFKSIYLDNQNVKLDVNRFEPVLRKSLELLGDR